jgi:hypothetical protein
MRVRRAVYVSSVRAGIERVIELGGGWLEVVEALVQVMVPEIRRWEV